MGTVRNTATQDLPGGGLDASAKALSDKIIPSENAPFAGEVVSSSSHPLPVKEAVELPSAVSNSCNHAAASSDLERGSTVIIDSEAEQSPAPKSKAGQISKKRRRIGVDIVSQVEDGTTNVFQVEVGLHLPFLYLMNAWYMHQEVPPGCAKFVHKNLALHPEQTPDSRGWGSSDGTIVVTAIP